MVQQEEPIDLSKIFTDISQTMNGVRSFFSSKDQPYQTTINDHSASSPISSLFSSNGCFKACGMEDIQFAAKVHYLLFFLETQINKCLFVYFVQRMLS